MSQCPSKNDPLQLDKTLTDIFVSLESVKPSEFNDVLGSKKKNDLFNVPSVEYDLQCCIP